MKRALAIIICILPILVQAGERKWTTIESLPNNDTLKLYWVGVYEGYDSIYKIDVLRKSNVLKTLAIVGQPLLNNERTYMAVKNCWDGGCQLDIRILDLNDYNELLPIHTNKESFIELTWQDSILNIELGAMNESEKTSQISVSVKGRKTSNKKLNQDAP